MVQVFLPPIKWSVLKFDQKINIQTSMKEKTYEIELSTKTKHSISIMLGVNKDRKLNNSDFWKVSEVGLVYI